MKVWIDIETFSSVDIKAGLDNYKEAAELLLFAWAVDDDPVTVWDATDGSPMPDALAEAICLGDQFIAHNASFERQLLAKLLPEFNWDKTRWKCTMAHAYLHGLPGALDKLCEIFKIAEDKGKQKNGRALVRLFCMPLKKAKLKRATRLTHPAEWKEFVTYCGMDVEAMRTVYNTMPKWNDSPFERELWLLDQAINDRGIAVDRELALGAVRAVEREQARLKLRTQELTNGEVEKATQRDRLLKFIAARYNIELPDMTADTLERLIADESLPDSLKQLIRVRLESSLASVSKYKRLLKVTSKDDRMRGGLQYGGAFRTMRWAGRGFQPQNLLRPTLKHHVIEAGIEAIKTDSVDIEFDNVMEICSNAVRGALIAEPGRKLVISDLSNIEGRKGAWFPNEKWKLQAFRDYDASLIVDANGKPVLDKKGERQFAKPDLYKVSYGKAFNTDPFGVTKEQRQIGKVMELFLQYQGGVGAFVTGAETYGIDLKAMAASALPGIPKDVLLEAERFWDFAHDAGLPTYDLSHDEFVACDSLKRLWRRAHPGIVDIWWQLSNAFETVVRVPHAEVHIGDHLMVCRRGAWTLLRLPTGRFLCYPSVRVKHDKHGRVQLTYLGINPYTKSWGKVKTYGGKIYENVCQASAREVMAYAMPEAEDAGYEIDLTVHDELLTETPDNPIFNPDGLSTILATGRSWTKGLPLAAAGFETYRYKKE